MRKEDLSTPIRLATTLVLAVSGCTRSMSSAPVPDYGATTNSMAATLGAMETHLAELKTAQSSTQVPTETLEPIATATATEAATPEKIATGENVEVGDWNVEIFDGATDQMRGWIEELKNLDPVKWPNFPNVDNPQAGFVAANGLEYGMAESVYCQQDQTCDIPISAGHYRIITADYDIPGIDACMGSEANQGCGIMLINVGDVTANFRDAKVDTGFTVFGRYWNGDKLPEAIYGGLSHVANNMLNLNSALNPDGSVNAGANCSVREGCKSVRLAFAIISGNELLVKGVTTVNR